MELETNTNMCRCCATEGTFKDVKTAYQWMGEEEVYSDMLRECFDVCLMETGSGDDGGICEVCITQLRNASNFKRQVLYTESQFKLRLQNKESKGYVVKLEPEHAEDSNESDNDATGDYDPDFDIKAEDEPKPKRPKRGTTTITLKKAKKTAGETSGKRSLRSSHTDLDEEELPSSTTETTEIKLKKGLNFSTFIAIKPESPKKSKRKDRKKLERLLLKNLEEKRKSRRSEDIAEEKTNEGTTDLPKGTDKMDRSITELNWQMYNAKTILRCSNATPISRINDKFACSYCRRIYDHGLYLKMHILEDHNKMEKPDFVQIKSLSRYIVYMDVTDLKCNVCSTNIDSIEELLDHLKNSHEQLIHENLNNHIIPLKFDNEDDLKCVLCFYSFEDFDKLLEHMNHHYSNYSCEFCGAGFVNRVTVIEHKKSAHNYVQKIKYKQGEILQ